MKTLFQKTLFLLALTTLVMGCTSTPKPVKQQVHTVTLTFEKIDNLELNATYVDHNKSTNLFLMLDQWKPENTRFDNMAMLIGKKDRAKEAEGKVKKGMSKKSLMAVLGEPTALSKPKHYKSNLIDAWVYFYPGVALLPKQIVIFKDGRVVQTSEFTVNKKEQKFDFWTLNKNPKWQYSMTTGSDFLTPRF